MNTAATDKVIELNARETQRKRALDKVRAEMGPKIIKALDVENINNINLNEDGKLWADPGGQYETIGTMGEHQAESLIRNLANLHSLVVNTEHPELECQVPFDGSRFSGLLPPCVKKPIFSIRKHGGNIKTLFDYVGDGVMTTKQCDALREFIEQRKNMIIVGGMDTGKTTLLNACVEYISRESGTEKIVVLEDTREIRCAAENVNSLLTSHTRTMADLLKISLRHNARRLIVGEVRDKACIDMLTAWNTGHPGGICTLHANIEKLNTRDAVVNAPLFRVETLCAGSIFTPKAIASIVDVIIMIELVGPRERKITDIYTVEGYDTDYLLKPI